MTFKFEINQADIKRVLRALDRLESKARRLESQHSFSSAQDYTVLVKKNLLQQKFASKYPPYNPRYAEWKAVKMSNGSAFWKLYGDLFRSISTFKVGRKDWFGGVPAFIYDKGGKSWFSTPGNRVGKAKRIAMYGHVNEQKRPLFEPTADEYEKNGWPKQGDRALRELGKQWR